MYFFSPCTARFMILTALMLSPRLSAAQPKGANETHGVRRFGAVGDGLSDDTRALQESVDSGGNILPEAGIYRITKPIVIDLDRTGFTSISAGGTATLLMSGAGPAIRVIGTHFKSADPGGVERPVWDRQRMPCIDGLGIVGGHPQAEGIEAIGTMQLTVTRTHIRKVLHAIHLKENNRNLVIADCHFYENRGIGVFFDQVNLHQTNISGCHISYCGQGGIVSRGGNVRNIQISGCDLESNMSPEQSPTANVLIDCTDSKYGTAEVAVTGCTIQHNHQARGSANIRIFGRSLRDQGEAVSREGQVTISGNVLSDVQVNIHLRDCRGVAITGNTGWRAYQHSALIENCQNVVIGANLFGRRSPNLPVAANDDPCNGVLLKDCSDCSLSGLQITQVRRAPAGLILRGCRRMNITGCTILDCDNLALLLDRVTRSRVSSCLMRDDRPEASGPLVKEVDGTDNLVEVPYRRSSTSDQRAIE